MVVVTGAGTVVCSDVVVVLLVGAGVGLEVAQADSATRAPTARHGMMSLFMGVTKGWVVVLLS